MSLNQTEIDYLASQPLGRLATLRPDGTLQNNPVGCHYNPATGTIDITGYNLAASQKFRNVAANDQIAFVVDDIISTQPWRVRCLEIRGTGETIEAQQPTETAPPPAANQPRRLATQSSESTPNASSASASTTPTSTLTFSYPTSGTSPTPERPRDGDRRETQDPAWWWQPIRVTSATRRT